MHIYIASSTLRPMHMHACMHAPTDTCVCVCLVHLHVSMLCRISMHDACVYVTMCMHVYSFVPVHLLYYICCSFSQLQLHALHPRFPGPRSPDPKPPRVSISKFSDPKSPGPRYPRLSYKSKRSATKISQSKVSRSKVPGPRSREPNYKGDDNQGP